LRVGGGGLTGDVADCKVDLNKKSKNPHHHAMKNGAVPLPDKSGRYKRFLTFRTY
jgi:hypothetical protein